MSLSRVGLSVLRGVRQRSSSASNQVHPGYAKTIPLKEKFGIEDSTPVFKKGGALDNLLYGATIIVCLTGIGLSTHAYYQFAQK